MSDPLLDSQTAEAANAAAVAKEAEQRAFVESVRMVLREEMSPNKGRYIDITRVALICQSIIGIDARLKNIEDNQKWAVHIIVGAVIVAVIALVLK